MPNSADISETQYIRDIRRGALPRPAGAPSLDLARSIAGRIEIHLINNNWEAAQHALTSGLADHNTDLQERAARSRRSRAQWLRAPLADLELPLRDHNAFEDLGCETIADAIAEMNSGRRIPNFGSISIERFWNKLSELKLADLRTLSAEEVAELHKREDRARAKISERKSKQKAFNKARSAAGGLGGRKAFIRGPVDLAACGISRRRSG